MNRGILFRGKRIDNGEWVEGYYLVLTTTTGEKLPYIIDEHGGYNPIDPATRGEYTGLKDKNDKRIFEGDVIATPWNEGEVRRVVHFENGLFKAGTMSLCSFTGFDSSKHNCEVIGNIYDPELMEVQDE